MKAETLVVSETPFYAEMGGQVGDTGEIETASKNSAERLTRSNTIHPARSISQAGRNRLSDLTTAVILQVDQSRRAKIEAHHSGTHLLNWALRKVLGNTITQKGSYVGPDRLRFDFSHGAAMTPDELAEVEKLVNEKIDADVPVKWEERAYAEVKGDPSILQFFGDKYGDTVRVVSIGDFSKELCGGTHVRQSGKIGHFKILHEAAIAAGIRRIEAASGPALIEHVREHCWPSRRNILTLRAQRIPVSARSSLFPARKRPTPFGSIGEPRETFRARPPPMSPNTKRMPPSSRKPRSKNAPPPMPGPDRLRPDRQRVPFIANMVDRARRLSAVLADALKTRWQGVAVLAAVDQGKVALLSAVAPRYTKKIQAGKIIQAIAPLVGGKGGGRPELAQGGGTNPEGVPAALAKAETLL